MKSITKTLSVFRSPWRFRCLVVIVTLLWLFAKCNVEAQWFPIMQHWSGFATDVFRGTGVGRHSTRTSPSGNTIAMAVGGRIVVTTDQGATWRSVHHPFDGTDSLVFYNEIGAQLVSDSLMLMNFVPGTPGYVLYRVNLVSGETSPVFVDDSVARGGQNSYHLFGDSLLLYSPFDKVSVSTNAGRDWHGSTQGVSVMHWSERPIILPSYRDSCRTVYSITTGDFLPICAPAPIVELLVAPDGVLIARTEQRPSGQSLQIRLRTSADNGKAWVEGTLIDRDGKEVLRPRHLLGVAGGIGNRFVFVRDDGSALLVLKSTDEGHTWVEEQRLSNLRQDQIDYPRIAGKGYIRIPTATTDYSGSLVTYFDVMTGEKASEQTFDLVGYGRIQYGVLSLSGQVLRLRNALAVRDSPSMPIRIVEDYAGYPFRARTLNGLRGIEPAKPRSIRCAGNGRYVFFDADGEFYYLRRQDTSYLLATDPQIVLDGGHVLGYHNATGKQWSTVLAGSTKPGKSASLVAGTALPLYGHNGGFIAMGYMQPLRHGSIHDSGLNRTLPYLPHEMYVNDVPEGPTFSASQVKGLWEVLLWYPANQVVLPGPAGVIGVQLHDSVLYAHRDGEADWRRIALPAGMACQSAIVRADGTILASLCSITREAGQTPVQSDLTVQRYDLSTNTWTEIEREFYRGPVITQVGMRRLLAAPDGHVYLGTLHRGIERLSADGTSWEAVGDGALDTTRVWDFDVAADGEIAVATSKGVFALRPTTRVANDGSSDAPGDATQQLDRNRVTLMRLRPTPATTTVTVELLNVDREPSGISSLKIHDLSGRVVADHTELAQAANGTRHKELRLDVSTLDAGTYVLHAVIGSQQPTLKILVVR